MIVTCDTNFYRKLAEGVDVSDTGWLDKIISVIVEAEKRKGIKAAMGMTVASELMSHLVDKPNEYSFKSCLKGCYALYKHCEEGDQCRMIPPPQAQIAKEYFGVDNTIALNTQSAISEILSEIAKNPNWGTLKKYASQLDKNKKHIHESEQCLINEIRNYCKLIDPGYTDWNLFVGDKAKRKQFMAFINSAKFEEDTARAMLCAVKMQVNNGMSQQQALASISPGMVSTFISSSSAALALRKYFWGQLLNEKFDLTKKSRANFLWDEQILYVVGRTIKNNNIILVTSDKKMLDSAASCGLGNCMMNREKYLEYLGVEKQIESLKFVYDKYKSLLVRDVIATEVINPCSKDIFNKKGKIYTFLNPVSYLTALDNKNVFSKMDGLFADGSLLVKAIKVLYRKNVTRRSFDMTSMAPELFEYASEKGCSIYIVASKQEQVEKAVRIFKERYPKLVFAGYRNGYFASEAEMDEEAKHIAGLDPYFLIVGMGALMQEKFLIKVKEAGYNGIGFTCGGFIHQTSKDEIDYYPAWVDKTNLRFLYRMWKEPHTRKRYLMAGLLFPIRFIAERLFG